MSIPIFLIITLIGVCYMHCAALKYIRMAFELKLALCALLDLPTHLSYPYLAYAEHIRKKEYSFFSGLVSTKTVMKERKEFLMIAAKKRDVDGSAPYAWEII